MNKLTFSAPLVACLLAFGAMPAAHATMLDFTTFPFGNQGTTTLTLPEASVTGYSDDLYVGDTVSNSICSIAGTSCDADLEIDFVNDVSNLVFDANGFNTGDFVTVTAYDAGNVSIGTFNITADGSFGFGALAGISWVYFDDSSTGAGLSFANITFDESRGTAVPEPNALALALFGLVGIGLALTRRRRAA